MSSTRLRLSQLAEQVKKAGLSGGSMTAELEKVATANDLTVEEISRIAEMANRDVQLGLYKQANDKRFKFELANAEAVKTAARKHASTMGNTPANGTEKLAALIDETGSDPFAAPYRENTDYSLPQYKLTDEEFSKIAAEQQDVADRNMLFELDKSRLEVEALVQEGNQFEAKIASEAVDHHKYMIQSAVDLISSGITLPSLYEAMRAAVSGSTVSQEEKDAVDDTMRLLLSGLKDRGVHNYQMGFRDQGDPDALNALSNDELLARCKALSCYNDDQAFSTHDTKVAGVYMEKSVPHSKPSSESLAEDAIKLFNERSSIADNTPPQTYLDDAVNQVGPQMRVFDGENEFVTSVKNLVGDQTRLRQVHAAQEYLGLKLKSIEEAMRGIAAVRAAEAEKAQKATTVNGVG